MNNDLKELSAGHRVVTIDFVTSLNFQILEHVWHAREKFSRGCYMQNHHSSTIQLPNKFKNLIFLIDVPQPLLISPNFWKMLRNIFTKAVY